MATSDIKINEQNEMKTIVVKSETKQKENKMK